MSLIARCDAVASDLNGLGLPAHKTVKYQRPLIVTPAMSPLLAVFPKESDPQIIASSSEYENDDVLVIAWFENAATSIETGAFDQTSAHDALAHVGLILDQLKTYGVGVPGSGEQNEATLGKVRYGHVEGGTWCAEIELKVTSWA